MGKTLFGGETSGTPIETRGATKRTAGAIPDLGPAFQELLTNPADRTAGLFASLQPFEQQQTDRQVADLRNVFGTLGGRFGKNVGTAEGNLRGQLSAGFERNRQQALLEANSQRIQTVAALLGFLNPQGPNYQQGFLGDLIGAGGNLAASLLA